VDEETEANHFTLENILRVKGRFPSWLRSVKDRDQASGNYTLLHHYNNQPRHTGKPFRRMSRVPTLGLTDTAYALIY